MKKETKELDLIELFLAILKHWKWMLVCALIFACIAGGYQYINKKSSETQNKETIDNTDIQQNADELLSKLTDAEKKSVITAVEINEEINQIQNYLDNSVYINLDPYHVHQTTLVYAVNDVIVKEKGKVVRTYQNYITNGGLAKEIAENKKNTMDVENLIDLISSDLYEEGDSQVNIFKPDDKTKLNTMFYIQIIGENTETVTELADITKDLIKVQESKIKKRIANHSLQLLDQQTGVVSISDVSTRIHEKKSILMTNVNMLNNISNLFSEPQKMAYEALSIEKGLVKNANEVQDSKQNEQKDDTLTTGIEEGVSLDYRIIGFLVGIFVYCIVYSLFFIFSDSLKSVKEIKATYTFPIYGSLLLKKKTKGTGEDLTGKQKDVYAKDKAQMLYRIKMACEKEKITKVYISTCHSLEEQEKNYVNDLQKQLKKWNIEVVLGENILGDISKWESLAEVGHTIVLYKIGTTTRHIIAEEHAFYIENNIDILGAIAIEC